MQQICDITSCGTPLTKGATPRGQRLCASCRNQLAGCLASLPRLYRACEQALEVRREYPMRVIRGRRSTGICLDDLTMAARADAIRLLASYCELAVDERGVTGPGSLDVETLTSFLHAQLDWFTAHGAAADFAGEIAALAADLKQVLNPAQLRTIDLGPCTKDGCGRMVRARIGVASQQQAPHVGCDAGHTWQPRQWLNLRHQLAR